MKFLMKIKNRKEFAKEHLNKKLIQRLRIFIIMFIGLAGYIIYDIIRNKFNFLLMALAFVLGVIIGALAGRMFKIQWHEETEKVVAKLDTIGIVVLILYIAFSIARSRIFGLWFHGPILTVFSFSFATGAILGRILSMASNIRKVLYTQGIYQK
jgi:hypothetical protein